jgi:hypothetical protein
LYTTATGNLFHARGFRKAAADSLT